MKHTILRVALVAVMSAGVVSFADAQRRHPGGGGGGSHSAPPPSGGGGGGAVPRGSAPPPSSAGRGDDGNGQSSGQATPRRYPGGGATASAESGRGPGGSYRGYGVPRGTVRPPWRPGGDYNFYYIRPYGWYYNPWGWGTFGFGYIWDPFWWGYPYGGGWGYPYGGGYYGGGYAYRDTDEGKGGVRLKVKPREAEVLVDGYYYGTVDDFDGSFQSLKLEKGPHEVTLRLNGFEPLNFKIFIVEHETITYKGRMQGK